MLVYRQESKKVELVDAAKLGEWQVERERLTLGPEVEAEGIAATASQPSVETSGASALVEKTFPSAFRGLVTAGKYTQQSLSSLFQPSVSQ